MTNDPFRPPYTGSVLVTRGDQLISERYFREGREVTRQEYESRDHAAEYRAMVERLRHG